MALRNLGKTLSLLLALLQQVDAGPALAAPALLLQAGAARVDITPALADLPAPFDSVGDPIYARSLVLDNGRSRAVIVIVDLPNIAPDIYQSLISAISAEAGAPAANIFVAVTHTHNAVRLDRNPKGIILPGSAKITAFTQARILESVRQAKARLQPARAGYAEGTTALIGPGGPPEGGRRSPVPVPPYPVDRSLSLFKVESTSGDLIAMILNTGLQPIMQMPAKNRISGDVAGVAERYIEQRYGNGAVVMYSTGAQSESAYSTRPKPLQPAPSSPDAITQAVGTLLGEDAIALSTKVRTRADLAISGALRTVRCPGKTTSPYNLPDRCSDAPGATLPRCDFKDRDSDPVDLQVGVLRIGGLNLVTSDADITQPVWQKLKAASPPETILVNLAFGPMHYVIDDIYYPSYSYHATATTAKPGCAAPGFIRAATELMAQLR